MIKQVFTYIIALILSVSGTVALAQGEYNNWVFGTGGIWLDFNNGTPVVDSINTSGNVSSTSMSDKNGNLLFWADVKMVFNSLVTRKGRVMDTTQNIMLNGDSIETFQYIQCLNAMPFPCNDSLYYLFSMSNPDAPWGPFSFKLYYSVINMNANGGLGAVVQKNILLDSNLATGFAMTRHANNRDYWISYQYVDTNIHVSRHISDTGIGPPVISVIGANQPIKWFSSMKFSPDATKLVNCFDYNYLVEVYDFDNATGTLSNPLALNIPPGANPFNLSGVTPAFSQFSPDMSKLYITGKTYVVQFDFSSGVPATIANSGIVVGMINAVNGLWDIALGPDGVIYITRNSIHYLATISNPNGAGTACNFNPTGFSTAGYGNTTAGLPTMLPNLFVHRDVLSDSLLCQYDTINLYLSDTNFIDSLVWNFGDTASGALNTSSDIVPLHVYNQYGTYPIEVIIYSGCVTDTIHDTIRINPTPIADLGNDTILCEGDSLDILFTDTSFSYLWSTGDSSLGIQVWQADTYWVELSSICGVDRDSVVIDSIIPAYVHFPNDTLMCQGDSLLLDATVQNGSYLWSTGDTSPTLYATAPGGTFWVQTVNICNADSDTIVVDFTHAPSIDLGNDSILCNGTSLFLNGWDTLSSFLWNTGDTTPGITVDSSGVFAITAVNLCGTDSDSIQLWFIDPPAVSLGNDTILCAGASIVLRDTSSAFPSYFWNTGVFFDSITVFSDGTYWLQVSNPCGSDADTITVHYDNSPVTNLGPDARYCFSQLVTLDAYWSRATYLWNTADTSPSITANYTGQYWVQVVNLCGYDDDTVNIYYDMPISFSLGPDSILCQGDSVLLAAPAHNASWVWSNGSSDSTLLVTQPGTYWVAASNYCGTFSDTVSLEQRLYPAADPPVPDTGFCEGNEVEVSVVAANASAILWQDGFTGFVRLLSAPGVYAFDLFNECGSSTDSFRIDQWPLPVFSLGNDTSLCFGERFALSFNMPGHSFLWENGTSDSIRIIDRPGDYALSVTSPHGCFASDELIVSACNAQLFVPGAFTPNGDGTNDVFAVSGVGIKTFHIVIYDRWGELVFESFDPSHAWDGSLNGQPAPAGVYVYRILYNNSESRESSELFGSVTLIR